MFSLYKIDARIWVDNTNGKTTNTLNVFREAFCKTVCNQGNAARFKCKTCNASSVHGNVGALL